MSVGEWVAIGVSTVTLLVALALLRTIRTLRGSVADVQTTVDALADGAPTLDQLKAAVAGEPDPAEHEPEPVVSRVPPVLRTRSVVKAMALGTGTAHAARRLRNGRSS